MLLGTLESHEPWKGTSVLVSKPRMPHYRELHSKHVTSKKARDQPICLEKTAISLHLHSVSLLPSTMSKHGHD